MYILVLAKRMRHDKRLVADAQAKLPGCEVWEQRMAHYAKIVEELGTLQPSVALGYVRVSVGTLASAIREEALGWLRALCERMRATDMANLEVGQCIIGWQKVEKRFLASESQAQDQLLRVERTLHETH